MLSVVRTQRYAGQAEWRHFMFLVVFSNLKQVPIFFSSLREFSNNVKLHSWSVVRRMLILISLCVCLEAHSVFFLRIRSNHQSNKQKKTILLKTKNLLTNPSWTKRKRHLLKLCSWRSSKNKRKQFKRKCQLQLTSRLQLWCLVFSQIQNVLVLSESPDYHTEEDKEAPEQLWRLRTEPRCCCHVSVTGKAGRLPPGQIHTSTQSGGHLQVDTQSSSQEQSTHSHTKQRRKTRPGHNSVWWMK